MGGIQNLISCVKMARSVHLAGSDCGDEYSLRKYAVDRRETPLKTEAIELSGKNSVMALISVFCSKLFACGR